LILAQVMIVLRAVVRLGLVATWLALTAGCGSSGSASTSTPAASAPTKATFIAKADAICTTARTQLNAQQTVVNAKVAAEEANDTATNRHALGDAVTQDIAIASPLLDQLRTLEPPAGDRVIIGKYLSAVAGQITLYQQFVTAVENNDAQAIQTVSQQIQQGKASAKGLAQGYGFKVCGSGG
jgi:hypothetical protein